MQVFATSNDPRTCAMDLDDKRVLKMILESSQLLSAAIYRSVINFNINELKKELNFYKITPHPKAARYGGFTPCGCGWYRHPLAIWACNPSNFIWLRNLLYWLLEEYCNRFGRQHSYYSHYHYYLQINTAGWSASNVVFENHTTFKNDDVSIHDIYKKYLYWKWTTQDKRPPKWTNTFPPAWYYLPTQYILGATNG